MTGPITMVAVGLAHLAGITALNVRSLCPDCVVTVTAPLLSRLIPHAAMDILPTAVIVGVWMVMAKKQNSQTAQWRLCRCLSIGATCLAALVGIAAWLRGA